MLNTWITDHAPQISVVFGWRSTVTDVPRRLAPIGQKEWTVGQLGEATSRLATEMDWVAEPVAACCDQSGREVVYVATAIEDRDHLARVLVENGLDTPLAVFNESNSSRVDIELTLRVRDVTW